MTGLIDWFVDPVVQYGFFRLGLATAIVVGATCSVLSCFLVIRGQALLGDAISHSVLLGVAVGYLVAGDLGVLPGALVAAIGAGLAIAAIERHGDLRRDAAMGVVFTTLFALGLALISATRPRGIDLFHVLFGNVLGVTSRDLVLTAAASAIVLGGIALCYRALVAWSFDAEVAAVAGLSTGLLGYVFTALLSATIVAALRAVGIILVIAMLIIPGATAQLLTRRLAPMLGVAVTLGVIAAVGGLYGSWAVDVASGPAMVIVAATLFLLAFVARPRRRSRARGSVEPAPSADVRTT